MYCEHVSTALALAWGGRDLLDHFLIYGIQLIETKWVNNYKFWDTMKKIFTMMINCIIKKLSILYLLLMCVLAVSSV